MNANQTKISELNLSVISLYREGKYEDALRPAYQSALLTKEMFGEDHPNYAQSLNNLAMLYRAMGAFEKAEPLYQQALQITKKALGEGHPDYAAILNNLGMLYNSMGSYQKAEPLYQQALQITKKALGEDHPDYVKNLNNLALLYDLMGVYEKAEDLYQQTLQIKEKVLGEDHPSYATSLNNLADLYRSMGAYDKALPLYRQALQITRKVIGENHPSYAAGLNNLAILYQTMGAFEKAESLYQQSLQVKKKVLGEDHPSYATSLNNLAELYKTMGAFERAAPLLKLALQILKKTPGEDHPEYAKNLSNLAMLYQTVGAYEQAAPLLQQALLTTKKALGENHPEYSAIISNLAGLYHDIGAYEKAEPLYQQALQITKKALGEDHSDYAKNLNNLALLYYSMGAYEKAEPLYQQALQIVKKALGADHPDYAGSLNNLAMLYQAVGAYEQAEPLYQQALQIRKKALGADHLDYAQSLSNLATLYAATGRANQALELMTTAAKIDDKMIGQVFSIGSEDQRLAYLSSIRSKTDAFLSLVFRYFPLSPAPVQDALNLVLKRKAITAEALAAQRDAILSGKYPHLRDLMHQLTLLRRQIAQKTQAGPGREGVAAYRQLLLEWNAEKERLEQDLARQVPEIKLEQQFRTADRTVIAHTLPPGSALVEFFRYDVFDFTAIPARGERQWKPARYCAFVLPSGEPDHITLIDLGEADQIDRFIASYKSKLTDEGRAPSDGIPEEKPGILSKPFGKKPNDEEPRSHRDLGAVPEIALQEFEREAGLPLYSALIAPLRGAFGNNQQLIIAPDSQLSTIPFEVIPTPDGGYLIDHYRIHFVGVGRDVLRFTVQIPGKPDKDMVMASPDFNLKSGMSNKKSADEVVTRRISRDFSRSSLYFPPLPGTMVEGKNIGALLGITPLLEEDALEARIKSLSSPLIFHIATHGFFLTDQEITGETMIRKPGIFEDAGMQRLSGRGMENPMLRSGLALAGVNTWLNKEELPPEAEDGILTAEDISGLDLSNTALAVLSACETGVGDVKTGEGVFGLRRAFALAGARTLVMSLWKVPDTPTQELMVDFYRRILAGTPKADALREAQLKLRKKYPHPRDWGAFICQGDPGVMQERV